MVYEKYFEKIAEKLSSAMKIYTQKMFKSIGQIENAEYFDTKEHLRKPPESGWQKLEANRVWGGELNNMWIRGTLKVPLGMENSRLFVLPRANAREILVFEGGKPCGIVNSKGEDAASGHHTAAFLANGAKANDEFHVALDCYAGHFCADTQPYDSYGITSGTDAEFMHVYEGVDLAVLDEDVCAFVFDLRAALQLATELSEENPTRAEARNVLDGVLSELILYPLHYSEKEWKASLSRAREKMARLFTEPNKAEDNGFIGIIGHSHMDTAWLWPVAETERKCARTYANALALMDEYPEYTFVQSSALHLDWMRRLYPDIFERIKARTAEGRYEPNGGVWVECDCNITSGELMVRQFLYGQRFTEKYLGYKSDTFWLPDTFGYNAAIPQIMRGTDVKYFYTTKIEWNDLNVFPWDTFVWRGLDGSEVFAHFNISHTFPDVKNSMRGYRHIKDRTAFNGKLLAFGFGDGGGGPTEGMVEDGKRAIAAKGLPKVEYTTISDFMKKVEASKATLPVYDGELYFELHRGTLTQMHDIKRNNRLCEYALHNMEYMNVLADNADREKIDSLYKTLLTNQFHDILPGTALTSVNELARKEVCAVIGEATEIAIDTASTLSDKTDDALTVFNTSPYAISNVTLSGDSAISDLADSYVSVNGKPVTTSYIDAIPSYAAKSFAKRSAAKNDSAFTFDGKTLETPFYSVAFDADGAITRLYDKCAKRELANAPLNTFYVGEDVPRSYDNWDIDLDTLELKMRPDMRLVSREVVTSGGLLFVLRSVYDIGHSSRISQDMIFSAKDRRIDFHSVIDWQDKHTLLKVDFDLAVFAKKMKNEIQFGHVERPTTRNNSLEAAEFEVCNHKWTDVSESRYGVSLLNDCKYGISGILDGKGGVDLRLSLHKSGTHPDVSGDSGVHEVTYSLLPHLGAFDSKVLASAFELNLKPVCASGKLDASSFVLTDESNIVVETIKPAEDNPHAFVLRLYEAEGARTDCTLSLRVGSKVYETNMLEENKKPLALCGGAVALSFKPFEIKTILVER